MHACVELPNGLLEVEVKTEGRNSVVWRHIDLTYLIKYIFLLLLSMLPHRGHLMQKF